MRALGIVPIAAYVIHAAVHLLRGEPYDLLWACHIAALLVGVGMLTRNATLTAIGFLWSCTGGVLWIIDLSTGGELIPTSILTHVSAFACGWIGVRKLAMPPEATRKALGAFGLLWIVCRVVTPPSANVNLTSHVHPGWEQHFISYPFYFFVLLLVGGAIFKLAERAA